MKKLTLSVSEDNGDTITHEVNLSNESTWLYQLEALRKFLLAQGFWVNDRIAIVEPNFTAEFDTAPLRQMFYDQLEESCWGGKICIDDDLTN